MVILINFPAPTEGIHHSEPNVKAYHSDACVGKGTIYIAESIFCWIAESGDGFSLPYQSIAIHAVSKDLSNFPEECLLLFVDGQIPAGQETETQALSRELNSLSVEEDNEETTEIRFVPDNKNMLDMMYKALSECQTINSDQNYGSDADDEAVVALPFTIEEENGTSGHFNMDDQEDGDEEFYEMDEEQFEDAEP